MSAFDRAEARSLSLPNYVIPDLIDVCEWCDKESEDLKRIPDVGYLHKFDDKGNVIPFGCPQQITSRVCGKCREEANF